MFFFLLLICVRLRIFVMSSQIRAEMWNRNGVSTMKGQMSTKLRKFNEFSSDLLLRCLIRLSLFFLKLFFSDVYMSALFSYWMLDADLFLLQYACCVMSNDDVIALLLEYFGVQRWLAKPKTITPLTKEENVKDKSVMYCFLAHLVIVSIFFFFFFS